MLSFERVLKYQNKDKIIKYIRNWNDTSKNKLELLYKQFIEQQDNTIKYEIYNLLKKNDQFFDPELLSDVLGIDIMIISNMFDADKTKKIYFPVIEKDKAILVEGVVCSIEKEIVNFAVYEKKQKESLKRISSIVKSGFFFIANNNFTTTSFMLAVIMGIIFKENLINSYAFSGIVNESGKISIISNIKRAKEVVNKASLKFVYYEIVDNLDELRYWIGNKNIIIPFMQFENKSKSYIDKSLQLMENLIIKELPNFSLHNLEFFSGIGKNDIVLNHNGIFPQDKRYWTGYLKNKIYKKMLKIYSRTKKDNLTIYFVGSIDTLMLGIGIIFNISVPFMVFQYIDEELIPVINLLDSAKMRNLRLIKKNVDEFKNGIYKVLNINNIEPEIPSEISVNNDNTFKGILIIWLAKEYPYKVIENFLQANANEQYKIIQIESADYKGDIPYPNKLNGNLWVEYISEVYSIMNILKEVERIEQYHIFLSVPTAIAFVLGILLRHNIEGIVYHFDLKNNVYFEVFDINELKDI